MNIISIPATETTPSVSLNHNTHTLTFEGESRPENVSAFYTQIFEWIEAYDKYLYFITERSVNKIKINCEFKLEYFNSSSAKKILDIITSLINIKKHNDKVELIILWNYEEEDEDMLDSGKEFEKMLQYPFVYSAL